MGTPYQIAEALEHQPSRLDQGTFTLNNVSDQGTQELSKKIRNLEGAVVDSIPMTLANEDANIRGMTEQSLESGHAANLKFDPEQGKTVRVMDVVQDIAESKSCDVHKGIPFDDLPEAVYG